MWLVLMVRLTSVPFSEKNRSIFMLARSCPRTAKVENRRVCERSFQALEPFLRFDPLKIAGLVEEVQIGFLRLSRNKHLVD